MIKQEREILRFTTAGSVDDGKSTLIGRLLYDSKSIFEDQLQAVESSSKRRGLEEMDLALLTDGLKDEREQGITIDVAYRYFSTPNRKFIIADTPGHIQYTRNMVTGASTANVALILVDARNGVVEQTKRHSYIASLLNIPHIVVCVNKMDLVDYSEEGFNKIVTDYQTNVIDKLKIKDVRFIPISALHGDNVVDISENMKWYDGMSLLKTLETIDITYDNDLEDVRFPIQTVIRPKSDAFHDYRGYAGRVAGGVLKKGETVKVLPSGLESKIKSIDTYEGEVEEAFPPMSVSIQLEDDIDLGRGNMMVTADKMPRVLQELEVMLCWLNTVSPNPRAKYYLKHTSNEVRAMIIAIDFKMDINTLEINTEDKEIKVNDICKAKLKTTQPLFVDAYTTNRITGSLILIDETTNETVAAGMVL